MGIKKSTEALSKINPDLERLLQKIVQAKSNKEKALLLAILKRKYPEAKVPK